MYLFSPEDIVFDKPEKADVTENHLQTEPQVLNEQLSKASGEAADKIETRMQRLREQLENLSKENKKSKFFGLPFFMPFR